jgi:hypothetical protein
VGGGARGGTPSHRLGRRIERRKNIYYKIHRGLKWPPIGKSTHDNQPKIGSRSRGEHGGDMQRAGRMGDVR